MARMGGCRVTVREYCRPALHEAGTCLQVILLGESGIAACNEGTPMPSGERDTQSVRKNSSLTGNREAQRSARVPCEEEGKGFACELEHDTERTHFGLVHQLFEAQVERAPHARALVSDSQSSTYVELNRDANRLAAFLRRKGVGPDQLVGLYFERDRLMVVALLGILKAGGAYVPLDPAYPSQRLAYLLKDSAPRIVLTEERLRPSLPGFRGEVIALDTAWKAVDSCETTNLDPELLGLNSSHLAYVIYTSGSTGEPKGVAAEHGGLVNRVVAQAQIAAFSVDDVCCHKTSIGFVDAVFEILGPLCYGCTLVVAPPSATKDPLELAQLLRTERVTRLISVPSLARTLLGNTAAIECLKTLRGWTLSGEDLREDLLLSLRAALPKCE